ncbi:MAG: Hsp20 family protein [Nitrososphaeraceae archaeon]
MLTLFKMFLSKLPVLYWIKRPNFRSIPIPEEIVSSKVRAKMSNEVLHIELPKKNPTKLEEQEGTTVEIV